MAQILIINRTSNSLSYVSGQVTVSPTGSSTVSFGLVPYLVLDPNFNSDLSSGNILISDTVTIYDNSRALTYLSTFLQNGPPQNSNDPSAFTLAGMGFSCTSNAPLTSSTETALLLLVNPPTSSVNARAMYFYAAPASSQGVVTISFYVNPIVTSNGTSLPINNNLVASNSPVSAMTAWALPTITNLGTPRMTVVANALADMPMFNFSQTAILTPGNSLLMAVSVTNLGIISQVPAYFYMQWVEA